MLEGNNKEYVEEGVLIFYCFRIIKVIYIFEILQNKATDETMAGVWWVIHSFLLMAWQYVHILTKIKSYDIY